MQEEITEIHRSVKVFKSAFVDLKTMAKGAMVRGQKAVEAAAKTKAAQAALNTESKAAADEIKEGAQKQTPTSRSQVGAAQRPPPPVCNPILRMGTCSPGPAEETFVGGVRGRCSL